MRISSNTWLLINIFDDTFNFHKCFNQFVIKLSATIFLNLHNCHLMAKSLSICCHCIIGIGNCNDSWTQWNFFTFEPMWITVAWEPLMMVALCCGAPILILLIITLLGYQGILFTLLPFICPIMMVLMMPMMLRGGNKDKSEQTEEKPSNQNLLS